MQCHFKINQTVNWTLGFQEIFVVHGVDVRHHLLLQDGWVQRFGHVILRLLPHGILRLLRCLVGVHLRGLTSHVGISRLLLLLIPSTTHARLLLSLWAPCACHTWLLSLLLSTPSLTLCSLSLLLNDWWSLLDELGQVLSQLHNVWVLWIPLLGVRKDDHILLTDIAARFYHFYW